MDDISGALSSFLSDPNAADKLKSMAAELMGSNENGENPTSAPQLPAFDGEDIDVGKIMKVAKLLKSNTGDERANLLLALKPHLSQDRRERVDKAVKILKLVSLVPILREQGILNF